MNLWKVLGVAGLAGVAAAGVIIVREQRQRTQLAPEEIRARLHERLAQATPAETVKPVPEVVSSSTAPRRWISRKRRRRFDRP